MKAFFAALRDSIKNIDKWMVLLCVMLSCISVTALSGIAYSGYVQDRRVIVQMAASALGLVGMLLLSQLDYRILAKLWKIHVPISYGLVLLTFVPGLAVSRDDDQAWLLLPGGLTVQPAEILKISFILSFAYHLQTVKDDINNPRTLLALCVHGAVPTVLVLLQGDGGTAMVFLAIFLGMIFSAGLDWKFIAAGGGAALVATPLVWNFLMDEHKRMRVLTTYNHALDPNGVGLQQRYGRRALGSGQLWGKGIFSGKHQYVPEMYNDFIFTFIGEAMGFIGCLVVLLLLGSLTLRILHTSHQSKDALGKFICVGAFSMMAFQIVMNVGMCLSILPVVGLTLPLISGGGTSVVITYGGLGLVMSVYANNKQNLFSD